VVVFVALRAGGAARFLPGRGLWGGAAGVFGAIALGGGLAAGAPATTAPVDSGYAGYRLAGEWLASTAAAGERVIDPKGLSLFYAGEQGYTFANLTDGSHDPAVRWVVAHDALMRGPWDYCTLLREIVNDRRPTRVFPAARVRGSCQVYVFDLSQPRDAIADRGHLPGSKRQ